jgi:excisionase family DNA binding protein
MKEYTLAEAGARIGRSPSTLQNQIHNGKLKARKVGKTYVVTDRELARYVEQHRNGKGAEA